MTASPHPADTTIPPGPGIPSTAPMSGGHGLMFITEPSSRWSARTLRIQRARKAWTSALFAAAGAKTWASPVQPVRSRWGQSVGIHRKLARWDHTTFLCSRVRRASEQANPPVAGRSEARTTPTASRARSRPG